MTRVGFARTKTGDREGPLDLEATVNGVMARHACVGYALGVLREGEPSRFETRGFADLASRRPFREDSIVRAASITKTFTAVAIMQLVEKGVVDLDADANDYLRAFRLVPMEPSFGPVKIHHLLTHSAGLREMVHPMRTLAYPFGESVPLDAPTPPLAEYYDGALRYHREPGTTYAYSDHSFAVLGQIVEDLTGETLPRYFQRQIFEPLGMVDSSLDRDERVSTRRATGYLLARAGPKPVADRKWITTAASSMYSTPADLARYAAALANGGANDHGRVLGERAMRIMFEPHYQPHPRIPGVGLSFSRFDLGGHLAVEHGGVLPGFDSDIFVAPDDHVAVLMFTNGTSRGMFWLPSESGRILGRLIGAEDRDRIRGDVPQRPDLWGDLSGRYQHFATLSDPRLLSMFGLGARVYVRNGHLMLRVLTAVPGLLSGLELHPDDETDPYVFRIDASRYGAGTLRVVFGRARDGRMQLHLEVLPVSMTKEDFSSGSVRI